MNKVFVTDRYGVRHEVPNRGNTAPMVHRNNKRIVVGVESGSNAGSEVEISKHVLTRGKRTAPVTKRRP